MVTTCKEVLSLTPVRGIGIGLYQEELRPPDLIHRTSARVLRHSS